MSFFQHFDNYKKKMPIKWVNTKLIRILSQKLTPVFTKFFQALVDSGNIPEEWKTAKVLPIFKKGKKNVPSNFRLVSLTSVLTSKVREHIIFSSIMKHLDLNNILNDAQHGFCK